MLNTGWPSWRGLSILCLPGWNWLMNLLYIVLPSAVVLTIAYLTYGTAAGPSVSARPKPQDAGV